MDRWGIWRTGTVSHGAFGFGVGIFGKEMDWLLGFYFLNDFHDYIYPAEAVFGFLEGSDGFLFTLGQWLLSCLRVGGCR